MHEFEQQLALVVQAEPVGRHAAIVVVVVLDVVDVVVGRIVVDVVVGAAVVEEDVVELVLDVVDVVVGRIVDDVDDVVGTVVVARVDVVVDDDVVVPPPMAASTFRASKLPSPVTMS